MHDLREEVSCEVIALAASAGGLVALAGVLAPLPADFPVPVVVVQHVRRRHPSVLAALLCHRTDLDVREAGAGDRLRAGMVWVAPPDYHLLVHSGGLLSLTQTAPVRFARPAADLLFESVASAYGERAIAVVLTGSGGDGSGGVRAIKRHGGTVIAQDRATSSYFGMPGAAIATGCVDQVLPLEAIAPALLALVMEKGLR